MVRLTGTLALATVAVAGMSANASAKATPDAEIGVPQAIEFDSATTVSEILIDVKESWTRQSKYFMDIEITGLNGGFRYHGNELVPVQDTTIFDANDHVASVVVDWTTDTTPRHVNEVYTVCVQVLKRKKKKNGSYKFKLKGEQQCRDFGPF